MIARIFWAIVMLVSLLFLPGSFLLIFSILGALLFPVYLEGVLLVFIWELAVSSPPINFFFYFPATITVLIAILLGHFVKGHLILYNH